MDPNNNLYWVDVNDTNKISSIDVLDLQIRLTIYNDEIILNNQNKIITDLTNLDWNIKKWIGKNKFTRLNPEQF